MKCPDRTEHTRNTYEMPGCVCLESENVPIMKDALCKTNLPILKGSSAHLIPILWCNIKLKSLIHKGN